MLDLSRESVRSELKEVMETWKNAGAGGFQLRDLGLAYLGFGVESDPMEMLKIVSGWLNGSSILIADIGNADEIKRDAKKIYTSGADMVFGYTLKVFNRGVDEWNTETKNEVKGNIKEVTELIEACPAGTRLEVPLRLSDFTTQLYGVDIKFDYLYNNLLVLAFTLPGTPYIVSGEELMQVGNLPQSLNWTLVNQCDLEDKKQNSECSTLKLVKKLSKMRKDGAITPTDPLEFIDVLPEHEEKNGILIFDRGLNMVIVNLSYQDINLDCPTLQDHVLDKKRYIVFSTPGSSYEIDKEVTCEYLPKLKRAEGVILSLSSTA